MINTIIHEVKKSKKQEKKRNWAKSIYLKKKLSGKYKKIRIKKFKYRI